MSGVLDIVALRSLTAIADSGGFHRAAESLHLSQSAVSQHVRRLEGACGRPLVRRDGRITRFTSAGELLVSEARRILSAHDDALDRLQVTAEGCTFVIGSTEHAADRLLPVITAGVLAAFPTHTVRFRIDRGHRLNQRLDDGALDASLFMGDHRGQNVRPAGSLPLAWYAAPGWQRPAAGPVPLVAIDDPCTIRRRAMAALSAQGLPASVVCEAGHLAGVLHATRAGLGVALLAHLGAAPEGLELRDDLPPVPPEPLHVRGRAGVPAGLLATIGEAVNDVLLQPAAV